MVRDLRAGRSLFAAWHRRKRPWIAERASGLVAPESRRQLHVGFCAARIVSPRPADCPRTARRWVNLSCKPSTKIGPLIVKLITGACDCASPPRSDKPILRHLRSRSWLNCYIFVRCYRQYCLRANTCSIFRPAGDKLRENENNKAGATVERIGDQLVLATSLENYSNPLKYKQYWIQYYFGHNIILSFFFQQFAVNRSSDFQFRRRTWILALREKPWCLDFSFILRFRKYKQLTQYRISFSFFSNDLQLISEQKLRSFQFRGDENEFAEEECHCVNSSSILRAALFAKYNNLIKEKR